jgi:hypothetical protein
VSRIAPMITSAKPAAVAAAVGEEEVAAAVAAQSTPPSETLAPATSHASPVGAVAVAEGAAALPLFVPVLRLILQVLLPTLRQERHSLVRRARFQLLC